jgi:hypothetical protein
MLVMVSAVASIAVYGCQDYTAAMAKGGEYSQCRSMPIRAAVFLKRNVQRKQPNKLPGQKAIRQKSQKYYTAFIRITKLDYVFKLPGNDI